jgi:hypothetical protein
MRENLGKLQIEIDCERGLWFSFKQGEQSFETYPDQVYDSINDLLTAVRLLYKGIRETECRFFEGVGEHVLVLHRNELTVTGTVYYFTSYAGKSINPNKGEIVFVFADELYHFTNQIINAYDHLNNRSNTDRAYSDLVDLMKQEKQKGR